MKRRILVVEDDRATGSQLQRWLSGAGAGWEVDWVERGEWGEVGRGYDLVLTDLRLPGASGLDLLDRWRQERPGCPIIVMTGQGTTDTALEATKRGAYDYLVKPVDPEDLLALVASALEPGALATEAVDMGEAIGTGPALVGRSRRMQELCREIGRLAGTELPVLILGETGTGKELVARALHQHGSRSGGPFMALNCAAIPEALLESELFGHERGAFTGATGVRRGRMEQAEGGTLLLDEIGELPAALQAKLLRVLQDGVYHRLGGGEAREARVRVVSATHRDLEREVVEGTGFREDLYFRLSGAVLRVPALRERPEDVRCLVEHLRRRHAREVGSVAGFSEEAMDYLERQAWPGNVRQLENVVRRSMLLARPLPVGVDHVRRSLEPLPEVPQGRGFLSAWVAEQWDGETAMEPGLRTRMVAALDRELVRQGMERARGNQAQVARWLGVARLKVRQTWAGVSDSGEGGAELGDD